MRYLMMVKATRESEAGAPPDPALMEAIGKLAEESFRSGVLVQMEGLTPSARGARVRLSRGKLSVTDGPFSEAKELVGGLAIIQADSREEAIEIGRRFMQVHADVLGPSYEGELEVRELVGPPPSQ
ncbi:MAG TPA: YciI family protein [Gemmatimonadaceae bacterium]|nr:YciI family protein [Gemmatimonadaceae bacterium]